MSERGVLHVNEILEDILGPRRVDPPGEIRPAQNVAPGAVNPVPRSYTPRAKLAAFLLPGCQRRAVGRPDQALGLELGRRIIGKHLFVTPRDATVVVVDDLHRKRRLFFPWPKPQPRASNKHGATGGVDEDAHACGARGVQHIPCPLDVHFFGEGQEPDVALVEADIGRGVKDGRLRLDGLGCAPGGGWCRRQWPGCVEGRLDLLSIGDVDETKVDVFDQAGRQIGARGGAYVEDSDLLRVLAALQQMADDPTTEKTGLMRVGAKESSKLVEVVPKPRQSSLGQMNVPRRRLCTFFLSSVGGTSLSRISCSLALPLHLKHRFR